jgi:predicted house-cleaning noncanonical NTP pyrophosphatase (MazG superfamily)
MMADGYPIKLVRDRVAEVDTSEGLAYRPVRSPDEHRRRLRAKLVEEVGEYLIDRSVEELADILEAIQCLAVFDCGVPFQVVEDMASEKFAERGGFREGVVMETIER